jgi:trigger factor
MQVSVESGEGLQRKVTVHIPSDKIDSEVENRLKSLQGRVKVDGFRPGKVPYSVVKQRYGHQVLHEVAGEIMQHSFQQAVTQENLKPAGDPVINAAVIKSGQPLEFTATFEVYPTITLSPFNLLAIETVSATVKDADVDAMIETLRGQRTRYDTVARGAATADRITVDFVGAIDGVAFEGGSGKDVPFVIGAGAMIPGFEEQLVGLAAGSETTVNVSFPADYQAVHLRAKPATFAVTVTRVEAPVKPELDDVFAKSFGVTEGGMDKLRQEVRANMERELENRLRADLKNVVMSAVLEANPVDAPVAAVAEEASTLAQQLKAQNSSSRKTADDFMQEARRRVQLGMILGEIVKTGALQISADQVRARLEKISKDYEDPDEVVRYYQSNPQMLRGIETLVMEDTVVDWIAAQAKSVPILKSFDEIMNPKSAT